MQAPSTPHSKAVPEVSPTPRRRELRSPAARKVRTCAIPGVSSLPLAFLGPVAASNPGSLVLRIHLRDIEQRAALIIRPVAFIIRRAALIIRQGTFITRCAFDHPSTCNIGLGPCHAVPPRCAAFAPLTPVLRPTRRRQRVALWGRIDAPFMWTYGV